MMQGALFDYFDRISIIHMPARTDRLSALDLELARVGLNIHDPKVSIPSAPMPETANGFSSKGVYGNFLSHLQIIQQAYSDDLESVLILEDDAIFKRQFNTKQEMLANHLRTHHWDELFIGHSVTSGLPVSPSGLVRFRGEMLWAHCYGVNRRIMPRLIDYFLKTIERPSDHPDGGKMYVDGAHNIFRKLNPDVVCLLSSPCLSVQKGSPSGLSSGRWYDRWSMPGTVAGFARSIRDECWRQGLITIAPKGGDQWTRIESATPWPSN
jgi:glycosyl transferase family 25